MASKNLKVHTGFRITKENLDFIEKTGNKLGLNKTNVLDMFITILRKDPKVASSLIQKAFLK